MLKNFLDKTIRNIKNQRLGFVIGLGFGILVFGPIQAGFLGILLGATIIAVSFVMSD